MKITSKYSIDGVHAYHIAYNKDSFLSALNEYMERTKECGMLGELGRPEYGRSDVRLGEVSHRITDLHLEDDNNTVVIEAEVLDTPKGNTLRKLISSNDAYFRILPRMFGTMVPDTDEDGKETGKYHCDIASITSWDVVYEEVPDNL